MVSGAVSFARPTRGALTLAARRDCVASGQPVPPPTAGEGPGLASLAATQRVTNHPRAEFSPSPAERAEGAGGGGPHGAGGIPPFKRGSHRAAPPGAGGGPG